MRSRNARQSQPTCDNLMSGRSQIVDSKDGEMSEWFKEHAWKACVRETVPWVRIPLSPPHRICSSPSTFRQFARETNSRTLMQLVAASGFVDLGVCTPEADMSDIFG